MRASRPSHAVQTNLESEKRSASAATWATGRDGSLPISSSARTRVCCELGSMVACELNENISNGRGTMRLGVGFLGPGAPGAGVGRRGVYLGGLLRITNCWSCSVSKLKVFETHKLLHKGGIPPRRGHTLRLLGDEDSRLEQSIAGKGMSRRQGRSAAGEAEIVAQLFVLCLWCRVLYPVSGAGRRVDQGNIVATRTGWRRRRGQHPVLTLRVVLRFTGAGAAAA